MNFRVSVFVRGINRLASYQGTGAHEDGEHVADQGCRVNILISRLHDQVFRPTRREIKDQEICFPIFYLLVEPHVLVLKTDSTRPNKLIRPQTNQDEKDVEKQVNNSDVKKNRHQQPPHLEVSVGTSSNLVVIRRYMFCYRMAGPYVAPSW